ncbi:MAG: hypothetical protein O2948_02900 [Proteobacteria bacterium]|jgi:hypothetical protein|nr:hypothetical protein [Pseudomonadota bacterium]MDA0928110.1 hypothetical protein [Pseudomonadota bacterium]
MFNLLILLTLLAISASIVVLVLYAIDRIKRVEAVAESLARESDGVTGEKPKTKGPFGGYKGKELWDIMTGKLTDKLSGEEIEEERQRFGAVLEKAVRLAFEDGLSDGAAGNPKQNPRNERMVKTLRGSVMSWLPSREVSTIYTSAYETARATSEDRERLQANLAESINGIFRQADIDVPPALMRMIQQEGGDTSSLGGDLASTKSDDSKAIDGSAN